MLVGWAYFLTLHSKLFKSLKIPLQKIYFVTQWTNLIRLLMKESLFITRIVYSLYFSLLGIFRVLLGFFYGRYQSQNERDVFFLLLLLQILYNKQFNDVLLEILSRRSLKLSNIQEFSKFLFKSIEQIDPRPLKMIFKKPDQKLQVPLPCPIIEEPPVVIETEVFWKEPISYKFELFKFYQNINEKVN